MMIIYVCFVIFNVMIMIKCDLLKSMGVMMDICGYSCEIYWYDVYHMSMVLKIIGCTWIQIFFGMHKHGINMQAYMVTCDLCVGLICTFILY